MKTSTTIKKLNKAGEAIEGNLFQPALVMGSRVFAKINGHEITFTDQGGSVIALYAEHVTRDQSNTVIDYHAGHFFKSVSSLLQYIS